jgi:microcystin-dependent protein
MSCTNCFNGCTEITSDKCVRYTGADIPELGIQNGDTLQFVEQTLAQYIISALDGTGIKPAIDPSIICSTVSVNLPTCGEFTITDLTTALIKSICDLQTIINTNIADIADINAELAVLNAPYSVPDCIEGTVDNESTHSVLQALLVNFCALVISLPNTYVALNGPGGINDIINQALIDEGLTGPNIKQYTKMVPYVAVPWFPTPALLNNFNSTGAGSGEYENIYFCNGLNNTPDMRGRVPAGLTDGAMVGLTMDPEVKPSITNPLIPTYSLETKYGDNFITLVESQMPYHNHIGSSAVTEISPNPHTHTISPPATQTGQEVDDERSGAIATSAANNTLIASPTFLTAATTLTIAFAGQNQAHKNTQPTIGCYYIMYIPA